MNEQRPVGNITVQKESHEEGTIGEAVEEHGTSTGRLQEEHGELARENPSPAKRKMKGDISMPPTTSHTRQTHETEWSRKSSNMRKLFSTAVTSIPTLLIVFSLLSSGFAEEPCQSPQYLQLGSTGVVNCAFQGDFLAIAWFNSTYTRQDKPLVTKRGYDTSGGGFGEFDIAEDGSLLILNVSLQHDHTFCVATVVTDRGSPPTYCVDVVTVVFPEKRQPVITAVRNCSEGVCFAPYVEDSIIRCSVKNARPAVNLTWAVRSDSTDQEVSHRSSQVPSLSINGAFSSYVTLVDPFMFSQTLVLAVCRANSQSNLLTQNESLILLQNMASDLSSIAPVPLYAALKSIVILNCSNIERNLLVWNRRSEGSQHMDMVAYAISGEHPPASFSGVHTLNPDGSLVISEVSVESGGTYICIAGDGKNEEARSYDVHVYAPASPEVEGCGTQGYCVLLAEEHDRLKCDMRGVIEGVRLGFTPLHPQGASITFQEQVVEIKDADDFVDVSVTATYHASGTGVSTFQCSVIGEHEELFSHTAVFSLYVEQAINTTPEPNNEHDIWKTVFFFSVAFFFGLFIMERLRQWRSAQRTGRTIEDKSTQEREMR